MRDAPPENLVGRDQLLDRLDALVARARAGRRTVALVAGESGIGKTSLLRAVAERSARAGAWVASGTCIDAEGAPGYWPWTQALEGLVRHVGSERGRQAAGDDLGLLASIVPSLGEPTHGESSERGRLLLMDAMSRFLDALAGDQPLLVVLDDLQWADGSSLALLDFLARAPAPAPIALVGAYRPEELPAEARHRLSGLASHGERVDVGGLDAGAVGELVERLTAQAVDAAEAASIHRRTGGHPFLVRELALRPPLDGGDGDPVPAGAREAIERRLARLPETTIAVLEAIAVAGSGFAPDVVAAALGRTVAEVEVDVRSATAAGVLTSVDGAPRFAHDLLRETVLDGIEPLRRTELHHGIGLALEARVARGVPVPAPELARHWVAAVPLAGPDRAVSWALAAAAAECGAFAFEEAVGHLRRLRVVLADTAVEVADGALADVLLAEADALARAGRPVDARGLLRHAGEVADRTDDPGRIAQVALLTAHLGAPFAARRDESVRAIEHALATVTGRDEIWEARLTATLARELQHSVVGDRPRAVPLSEQALEIGRRTQDGATLLACLLARHDVLWVPGSGSDRAAIAAEIVATARTEHDDDGRAEGQLLLANALLEQGSAAFEPALEECLAILDARRLPGHRYTALTRRACVALLRGDLEAADRLIDQAAELGERIREPDAGNVRMSQRLELVRAGGEPDELRAFARDAVGHWTGAPVHAHAVAAGFLARAGDTDAAGHHVATVMDLGGWQADRSYLWSVYVRELAWAAITLDDRVLCRQLLDELDPLRSSCGVNGAVVAFAGSHAHTAGLLAAALGEPDRAGPLLDEARATYRRLGAAGWLADLDPAPAPPEAGDAPAAVSMRRMGAVWELAYAGRQVTVPHSKGLADIARLVSAPGRELHVLDLMDGADRSGGTGDLVDRRALDAYRQRLAALDTEVDDAEACHDLERRARAEAERQDLVDELSRVTGAGRRPRQFANHPAERARKAVAGRVRDAIRKLEPVLPELAAHLGRSVVTGTYCRYRPDAPA